MVFCSPWVKSLYYSPVVGSVQMLCYCRILYLIKKSSWLLYFYYLPILVYKDSVNYCNYMLGFVSVLLSPIA